MPGPTASDRRARVEGERLRRLALVYFVLLSLAAKGAQWLPWPTWLQVVVFLVAWVIISGLVYGVRRMSEAPQVPPGRPAPLSAGAELSDGRPETEASQELTKPSEPEPTAPPEPELLKPKATPQETVDKRGGKAERLPTGSAEGSPSC